MRQNPRDAALREAFDSALAASVAACEARRAALPSPTFDASLPVAREAERIVELIRAHQVIVVAGETGSGKTTQLPKMCLAAGRGAAGMIGCTQPRRIADDEEAARAVPPFKTWESTDYGDRFLSHESDHSQADSLFVDRFAPARVLAECEAKRRIVQMWADPTGQWSGPQAEAARAQKDRTLRILALPYADHPDYDEAWRP